jgi:putative transposase
LPTYQKKISSIDALIPTLCLKGVSIGDFAEELETLLEENAKGLSPTNTVRLKEEQEKDFK